MNTFLHEMRDLVFHQRDKWRDDETETVHCHCRHLETDALASTRGQQCKRVLPLHHRVHDVLLKRTKRGITPIMLQNGSCCGAHNEGKGTVFLGNIKGQKKAAEKFCCYHVDETGMRRLYMVLLFLLAFCKGVSAAKTNQQGDAAAQRSIT